MTKPKSRQAMILFKKNTPYKQKVVASRVKYSRKKKHKTNEDAAPGNVAGGGNVAGIGIGPSGEPGISKKLNRKALIAFLKRRKWAKTR